VTRQTHVIYLVIVLAHLILGPSSAKQRRAAPCSAAQAPSIIKHFIMLIPHHNLNNIMPVPDNHDLDRGLRNASNHYSLPTLCGCKAIGHGRPPEDAM